MSKKFLLMNEQSKWLLEMKSSPEDAVKTAEITTEDLEYYINAADKVFERTYSNSERSSILWVKCCQTALHATEKL